MSQLELPISIHHLTSIIYITPLLFCFRYLFILTIKKVITQRFPKNTSQKAAESIYYFVQYTCLFSFSKHLINKTQIAPFNLSKFFQFYPERLHFDPLYAIFFSTEISVYLVSIAFSHMETRASNSDYYEMIAHHFVTFALILTGYGRRHFEYALLVANLHDVTDLFLESSKALNYLIGDPWSVITFFMFTIAFFVTRILIFPAYLILPIVNGVANVHMGWSQDEFSLIERLWFVIVLSGLWLIDCYWMLQIIRMIKGMLRLEIHGDIRDKEECNGNMKLKTQ